MKTPKELKALKDTMLSIQTGNYDVEAENPKIVKCWERLACQKTECPAHGKLRCWSVAGTSCHGEIQGEFAQKLGDCRQCVVYKESCGDEIGELVEVFNQMVKNIRHDLDERDKKDRVKAQTESASALESMAAALAHETRNPLHSIGMAAAYLKKNFHGELVTEFLSIIEEEVRKLNDLAALFLNFSHPAPFIAEVCETKAIIESVKKLLHAEAQDKNITIHLEQRGELPDITCDVSRFKQAIMNLVENAITFSHNGGTITIVSERDGDHLKVSVQDNGPGIAGGDLGEIFKPFFSTRAHGHGLGLAIVERTAREHQGTIEVESAPGSGATFILKVKTGSGDGKPFSSGRLKIPGGRPN